MTTDPTPTPAPGSEPEPKRELAVSQQAVSRDLVVAALRTLPSVKLGLSVARLTGYVTEYRLDQPQVEQLLALRSEYGAGIPAVMNLYARGVDLDTVHELYLVRQAIKDGHADLGGHGGITIVQLLRLRRAYGLADYEPDEVADVIAGAHRQVSAKQRWIKFGSQTAILLLEVARSFPGTTLEGAVKMIASQHVPTKEDLREKDPMEDDD